MAAVSSPARVLLLAGLSMLLCALPGSGAPGGRRATGGALIAPSAPTLLSPADGARLGANPVAFRMSAAAPGTSVSFCVEILRDGQVLHRFDEMDIFGSRGRSLNYLGWDEPSYASGATATLTVPVTLEDGTYQWHARAYAWNEGIVPPVANPGSWSETRSFSLGTAVSGSGPVLYGVTPNIVSAGPGVTLRVRGANLPAGLEALIPQAQVTLQGPDGFLAQAGSVSLEDAATVKLVFDLTGCGEGPCDLVVKLPVGGTARASGAVTVAAPVDLAVTAVSLSPGTGLAQGQSVRARATVKNVGRGTTSGPVTVMTTAWGQQVPTVLRTGLPAGAEAIVEAQLTVMAGAASTLRTAVDGGGTEADPTNNAMEIPLPAVPLPDLSLSGLQIDPKTPVSGDTVRATLRLQNAGGRVDGTLWTGFFVDGVRVANEPITGSLGMGEGTDVTIHFSARAGMGTLTARADPDGVVPESEETNNDTSLALPAIKAANLSITSLKLQPAEVTAGSRVTPRAQVHNSGPGAHNGVVKVRFEADGQEVGTATQWVSLAANGEVEICGPTWRARPGAHTVTAIVDPLDEIGETDEADNSAGATFSADSPDLIVADARVDDARQVMVGGSAVIRCEIKNTGKGGASDFTVGLEVAGQPASATARVYGLPAGSTASVALCWQVRQIGTPDLQVVADVNSNVTESDETNNTKDITAPSIGAPDLVVSDVSFDPPALVQGQTVRVNARLKNTGAPFGTASVPVTCRLGTLMCSAVVAGPIDATARSLEFAFPIAVSGAAVSLDGIEVVADPKSLYPDADRGSNQASSTANLTLGAPDLAVTAISLPADAGPLATGTRVTATVTVENLGSPAQVTRTVSLTVDGTAVGTATAAFSGAAGERQAVEIPFSARPGTRFDFAAALVGNSDALESNDTLTQSLPLSVTACDLQVTRIDFDPSAGVAPGTSVHLNVTVRNNGPGDASADTPFWVYTDVSGTPTAEGRRQVKGLAAGAEAKLSLTWRASTQARPQVNAIADSLDQVAEADETNNALSVPLPFVVGRDTGFSLTLSPAAPDCPAGVTTHARAVLTSNVTVPSLFDLSVGGAAAPWIVLGKTQVYMQVGGQQEIDLALTPPAGAAAGASAFRVTATLDGTNTEASAEGTAGITAPTAITGLLPADGQALPSDTVLFTWRTAVSGTSTVFLRKDGDAAEQRLDGPAGTQHQVTATGLVVGARYRWRARTEAGGSASEGDMLSFTLSGGVAFAQRSYTAAVQRDYLQIVKIPVKNVGATASSVLASAANPYDPEIVVGFAGAGSVDEPLQLAPGESRDLTFVVHAPQAARPHYDVPIQVVSGSGTATLTDTATVGIDVPLKADLVIQKVGTDPVTLVQTYRLLNRSDVPVADVRLQLDDSLKGKVAIRPDLQMLRVEPKGSATFALVPIFELDAHRDPDFRARLQPGRAVRVDTPQTRARLRQGVGGSISAVSAAGQASADVSYSFGDQSIYGVPLANRLIESNVSLDVCTNQTDYGTGVPTPPNEPGDPFLIVTLEPRNPHNWPVQPHTMQFKVNGYPVGSLVNQIPDGTFFFNVPASVLNISDVNTTTQRIELHTTVYNSAHYWRTGTVKLGLFASQMVVYVAAHDEDEALRIAQDQPYFQAHNDPEKDKIMAYLQECARKRSLAQRERMAWVYQNPFWVPGTVLNAFAAATNAIAAAPGQWDVSRANAALGWQNNALSAYDTTLERYRCTGCAQSLLDDAQSLRQQMVNDPSQGQFGLSFGYASSVDGGHYFAVAWPTGTNPMETGTIIDPWPGQQWMTMPLKDVLGLEKGQPWDPTRPNLYANFAPVPVQNGKDLEVENAVGGQNIRHQYPEFTADQRQLMETFQQWQRAHGRALPETGAGRQAAPAISGASSLSVTCFGGAYPLVSGSSGQAAGVDTSGRYVSGLAGASVLTGQEQTTNARVLSVEVQNGGEQSYHVALSPGGAASATLVAVWKNAAGEPQSAAWPDVPLGAAGRQAGPATLDLDLDAPAPALVLPDGQTVAPLTGTSDTSGELAGQPLRQILPAGLAMLSLPAGLTCADPAVLFSLPASDLKLARWNPEAGGGAYSLYPDAFASVLPAGSGCWAKLPQETPVEYSLPLAPQDQPFAIPLRPGWNIVGSPFPGGSVAWDLQAIRVRKEGQELSLADAEAQGWISSNAWGWQQDAVDPSRSQYVLVYDTSVIPGAVGAIDPWKGYWVHASAACDLLLPPPASGRARPATRLRRASGPGWSFGLVASDGAASSRVLLGAAGSASGVRLALPPAPPGGAVGPTIASLTGAQAFGVDLRPGHQAAQEWQVVVTPGAPAARARAEVRLTWPNLGAVPRDIRLTLIDTATGVRRSLRSMGSYAYASDGAPRSFRIQAERRDPAAPLLISALDLSSGRAGGPRTVRFQLSDSAAVSIDLLSPTGRVAASVARSRACPAGANLVPWAGTAAPGLYLLRAIAVAEDGTSVQAVRPVVVTR